MDYGRPALAERLACEYVLGTLRGPARRRFEALRPAHPVIDRAVRDWERRLTPLATGVKPVAPRAEVWRRLERRLFGEAAAPLPWWRRLGLWQGLSAAALAGVVGLGVLVAQPPAVQPPVVVVLAANPAVAGQGLAPARFVASLTPDGRALVLKPVDLPALGADRALELWALPGQGAPRSLGLVNAKDGARVLRAGLLEGTAGFAVSLEPAGGSTTGAPTGPILSVGHL